MRRREFITLLAARRRVADRSKGAAVDDAGDRSLNTALRAATYPSQAHSGRA